MLKKSLSILNKILIIFSYFCHKDDYEGCQRKGGQMREGAAVQHSSLIVKVAERTAEIEQAMQLRYQSFIQDGGAAGSEGSAGMERDEYDAYCDHLIVVDEEQGQVVGTYRLLPGKRAVGGIGFYSETEFQLADFRRFQPDTLELGRSCISPAYRNGRAIQLLWEGIARYVNEHAMRYLIGCASMKPSHQEEVNEVYSSIRKCGISCDHFGIQPRPSHRITGLQEVDVSYSHKELIKRLPPLLKGYVWLGAKIAGEPACDPLFQTTDFFVLLETTSITDKYKRHFLHK